MQNSICSLKHEKNIRDQSICDSVIDSIECLVQILCRPKKKRQKKKGQLILFFLLLKKVYWLQYTLKVL